MFPAAHIAYSFGYESVWLVGSGRNSMVTFGNFAWNGLITASGYGVPTPRKVSHVSCTGAVDLGAAAACGAGAVVAAGAGAGAVVAGAAGLAGSAVGAAGAPQAAKTGATAANVKNRRRLNIASLLTLRSSI